MLEVNKTHIGHVLDLIKQLPDESIDCCVTSPPYFGLRNYGLPPQIWDENDKNCKHEWKTGIKRDITGGKDNPFAEKLKIKGVENYQKTPDSQYAFCIHCNAFRGSLGLEPTFDLYLQHLKQIFAEVKRVLKPTGTCFVNLGDTYNAGRSGGHPGGKKQWKDNRYVKQSGVNAAGLQAKSLCLIPERFIIMMVDELGFLARNKIVWHKRNTLPSSAKDRFTVDWEPVFFFTKQRKYYFEQQFEPVQQCSIDRLNRAVSNKHKWVNGPDGQTRHTMNQPRPNRNTKIPKEQAENYSSPRARYHRDYKRYDKSKAPHEFEGADHLVSPFDPEKGRNKRCVWDVPTQPFHDSHFAVFPEKLVETPILAGCPQYICNKCGKAREKIYTKEKIRDPQISDYRQNLKKAGMGGGHWGIDNFNKSIEFTGYTDCGCKKITCIACGNVSYYTKSEYEAFTEITCLKCNSTNIKVESAGFHPGIVLDPFMGSGTTGKVALAYGRNYIGFDLGYEDMSKKRTSEVQKEMFT